MSIFLAKEDVAELTGRKTKTKQIEQLRRMGIVFWVNALGVPVVPRWVIEGKSEKADLIPSREKVVAPALDTRWRFKS